MPRCARTAVESGIYHVVSRGITRQRIFEDDRDRTTYLALLATKAPEDKVAVHAWCLMDNHIHLLLESELANLSRLMARVGSSYARYFNDKYERSGPLLEGRYHSEGIADDAQYLAALRYVHQNPERAGIARTSHYPWSSYSAWVNERAEDTNSPDIETRVAAGLLGSRTTIAAFLSDVSNANSSATTFYDVPEYNPRSDESLARYIRDELGTMASAIAEKPKPERNAILRALKEAGFRIRRIERVTGIGRGIIQRA